MEPSVIKRGALPPKNPTEGLGWRDPDTRQLYVWRTGRGWVQHKVDDQPAPVSLAARSLATASPAIGAAELDDEVLLGGAVELEEESRLGQIIRRLRQRAPSWIAPLEAGGELVCGPPAIEAASLALIDHSDAWRVLLAVIEALQAASVPPPPSPPPPPPRPVLPPPRPPRVVAPPPPERPEQHPILARHGRSTAPLDPRRSSPRRRVPPEPDFPPEFLAKLARVAEGAEIVEVRHVSTRSEGDGLFGSSLNFEG